MTPEELKARCKQFSLRVMRLVRSLSNDRVSRMIANQLVRSGTSVAANYRAACLAKLELINEDNILPAKQVESFMKEANELTAIFCASIKTARQNNR